MFSESTNSSKNLSTAQIQNNLREPLVENPANPSPPPSYPSAHVAVPPIHTEPLMERPSTWGSIACGGLGILGGSGAGYATFGFPWGLAGAALCLPGMVCGFRLFKNFDASKETKKSHCMGFAPKNPRPG